MTTIRQNAHLTFKGNEGFHRHGWLRLTPAYSFRLISSSLRDADQDELVLDPFSGTGTTGLAAAERGMTALLLDINPFLVWFAQAKTRNYDHRQIVQARARGLQAVRMTMDGSVSNSSAFHPPIHQIDRWWSSGSLHTLGLLKGSLDSLRPESPGDDLLKIAFCRVMIARSNAAFNHQSMSFKEPQKRQLPLFEPGLAELDEWGVLDGFTGELEAVLQGATNVLPGKVNVHLDDARKMNSVLDNTVDLLFTSPPYVNRMSYIRELRPYMYWLGFLANSRQAGEIDWQSIGGTWGSATSRLSDWKASEDLPLGTEFPEVLAGIAHEENDSGTILSRYVHKYFSDIYLHLKAAYRVVKPGGCVTYVVGNSTFYGVNVPTEQWYAKLLEHLGFCEVKIEILRKRNSNKRLFEFSVRAFKP